MVLVILGEILPQWEVALVSGYQKRQSDMGSPIKKLEKQALKVSCVLNFRLNFKVVIVVPGEILPQWEVALVTGYQKLQSDMGVTY